MRNMLIAAVEERYRDAGTILFHLFFCSAQILPVYYILFEDGNYLKSSSPASYSSIYFLLFGFWTFLSWIFLKKGKLDRVKFRCSCNLHHLETEIDF